MNTFEVQTFLKNRGFDPGDIDGIYGEKTEGALADYALHLINTSTLPEVPTGELELDDETILLIKELEREEGRVLHAYQDHLGYWTIGIGRLIDKRRGGGITDEEADYLKRNDVLKIRKQLDQYIPWWRTLDPVRQRALQNMTFQLGIGGLLKFTSTLPLIKAGNYSQAAANLRVSLWAKQTPSRAKRMIKMIETGKV